MTDTLAFGLFATVLLGAVAVGEALRRWAGWPPEATRRVVHVGVGLATALCPPLFSGPGPIYALAAVFVVANAIAAARGLVPSMHAVARRTWGTVIFPLALIVALALTWSVDPARVFALQLAFAVLALADPAASWVGTGLARPGRYLVDGQAKSAAGSAAFALVAAAVVALALGIWTPEGWTLWTVTAAVASVAVLGTAAEALGRGGWDNLAIVLVVAVALVALHEHPESAGVALMGVAAGGVFVVGTLRTGVLTISGALAGGVFAWMLIALGGSAWAVPALAFFVVSSVLSRVERQRREGAEALAEKGSRRDAGQVLANSGVGAALLALVAVAPADVSGRWTALAYVGFVGAFAAAAADTWATEIGTLVAGTTRTLGLGRRVPPGTSGGVSLGGTLGAVAGAASVALAAALVGGVGIRAAAGVTAAGVAAAFVDTLLGATVQARYWRPDGALTERTHDAGVAHRLAAGWRGVTNDRVNLAATATGALLAMLLVRP